MRDKLVIEKKKPNDVTQSAYRPLFVTIGHHSIIKSLSEESGVSMREITERLIDFGVKRMELIEQDGSNDDS